MNSIPAPDISSEAQLAFKQNHTKIIDTLVTRLLKEPGQFVHLGEQAESILRTGFEFTSSSLEACMQINDASLLIDQLRWANDRLPHDGIGMERMIKNLHVYCEVISEMLPENYSSPIVELVQSMISIQKEIAKEN